MKRVDTSSIKPILLAVILIVLMMGCEQKEANRPNVVIIISDDHRGDLMGIKGHRYIETPNLDRLASQGVLFENAVCVSGVCSPSRATILTGKYDHNAAAPYISWDNNSFQQNNTFMKELHKNGYYTGHIGKWHLGERTNHLQEGYDHWAGMEWLGKFDDTEMVINGEKKQFEGFSDDIIASLASEFIKERSTNEQPFALYIGLKSPHMPFGYPKRLSTLYDSLEIPKPLSINEDYDLTGKTALKGNFIRFATAPFGIKGWKTWERYIKSYYRSTSAADAAVGQIMESIEKAGISDNTIILYTSDQGYNNGEHGLTEKHFAYEPVMNVPMIMKYPKVVEKSCVVDDMVATIDIFPTVLELCDIYIDEKVDGKSWVPLLTEPKKDQPFREEILFAYNFQHPYGPYIPGQLALRTLDHKLITYTHNEEVELYDLKNDPEEMNNLALDGNHKDLLESMEGRLNQMIASTNWHLREREPIRSVEIFGPMDSLMANNFAKRMSNTALENDLSKNESVQFRKLSDTNGSFDISDYSNPDSGFIVLKFDVVNDNMNDLYTGFSIKPFSSLTGYVNGELFVTRNRPRPGDYNPPMQNGLNKVVFSVKVEDHKNLKLELDKPGDWVYTE